MKTRILSILIILAFCFSLVAVVAPPLANPVRAATTWYVNPGESIQAAVDGASSGDTIIVREGTYTENVDVNKDHLTIKSENGAEATIVQAANPDDDVFWVKANYVEISGFTVTGTNTFLHAGISASGEHLTICRNYALLNFAGIYVNATMNSLICNNTITDNGAGAGGAGIEVWNSANNRILNNNLRNNIYQAV